MMLPQASDSASNGSGIPVAQRPGGVDHTPSDDNVEGTSGGRIDAFHTIPAV